MLVDLWKGLYLSYIHYMFIVYLFVVATLFKKLTCV